MSETAPNETPENNGPPLTPQTEELRRMLTVRFTQTVTIDAHPHAANAMLNVVDGIGAGLARGPAGVVVPPFAAPFANPVNDARFTRLMDALAMALQRIAGPQGPEGAPEAQQGPEGRHEAPATGSEPPPAVPV